MQLLKHISIVSTTMIAFCSVCYATPNNSPTLPIVTCSEQCKIDLQKMLDDYRVEYQIPALAMSVSISSSQPTLDFYSGTTTRDGSTAINSNNIFEVGSLTKSVTGSIILQLEAAGKLNINDTVGKWLPEYTEWQNITIKQLMNMTGGIKDYENDDAFKEKVNGCPACFWSMPDIINWIYPNIDFAPGTNWYYSNTHFTMLGEIIEKVTGKTVEEIMQAQIIKPLQLTNTLYDNKLVPINLANFVHGYDDLDDVYAGNDDADFSISTQNTQGGLFSTANSLNKWFRALFGGKFLPQQQFQEMTSVVCLSDELDPDHTCKPGEPLTYDSGQWGYNSGLTHNSNFAPYGDLWWQNGETIGHQAAFFYLKDVDFLITFTGSANNAQLNADFFGGYGGLLAEVYDYLFNGKYHKKNCSGSINCQSHADGRDGAERICLRSDNIPGEIPQNI